MPNFTIFAKKITKIFPTIALGGNSEVSKKVDIIFFFKIEGLFENFQAQLINSSDLTFINWKSAHVVRIKSIRSMFGTSILYWKPFSVESATSFIQMENSLKTSMVTMNIVRDTIHYFFVKIARQIWYSESSKLGISK